MGPQPTTKSLSERWLTTGRGRKRHATRGIYIPRADWCPGDGKIYYKKIDFYLKKGSSKKNKKHGEGKRDES